jgi:hypothetical protein
MADPFVLEFMNTFEKQRLSAFQTCSQTFPFSPLPQIQEGEGRWERLTRT